MADISAYLKDIRMTVEKRLKELMDTMCEPGILKDAMLYSLMAGGKRLRPALCLMSAGMFGDEARALDLACAIEMIHTYSLIHDDLPAMDNDTLRRGKPTSHVVFGEAYAILAGDGLLNCAFEVMLRRGLESGKDGLDDMKAMAIVAGASGVSGMIAGQVADMEFEGSAQGEDVLEFIHERKTAAMIKASVLSGAALFGASGQALAALETYGGCIGLSFQIVDDILDEIGDQQKMGKTLGKDADTDKQTFVRLYGIEKSREIVRQKTEEAKNALECFDSRAEKLVALAEHLAARDA